MSCCTHSSSATSPATTKIFLKISKVSELKYTVSDKGTKKSISLLLPDWYHTVMRNLIPNAVTHPHRKETLVGSYMEDPALYCCATFNLYNIQAVVLYKTIACVLMYNKFHHSNPILTEKLKKNITRYKRAGMTGHKTIFNVHPCEALQFFS